MMIGFDAKIIQPFTELVRGRLSRIFRHADATHIQTHAAERVDEPQYIHIIRDAEISADLVSLNILRADDNDNLRLILQFQQHMQLGVRLESRKYSGGVVIIKQLSTEFQIKLIIKLSDSL